MILAIQETSDIRLNPNLPVSIPSSRKIYIF